MLIKITDSKNIYTNDMSSANKHTILDLYWKNSFILCSVQDKLPNNRYKTHDFNISITDIPEIKALDYKNQIWSTKSKVNKINGLSFCTSYTEVLGTHILTDSLNRFRHLKIDNCIPLRSTKEMGIGEAIDLMPFGNKNIMSWD